MYQFALSIGRSSGYEVAVNRVPPTTIVPEGFVAVLVPENTGKNGGHLMRLVETGIGDLLSYLRTIPATDQASFLVLPATESSTFGATSAGSDTAAGAAINATPAQAGQSVLVSSALTQCFEVAREYINTGLASPIVP
jgi:hypothetical protein